MGAPIAASEKFADGEFEQCESWSPRISGEVGVFRCEEVKGHDTFPAGGRDNEHSRSFTGERWSKEIRWW